MESNPPTTGREYWRSLDERADTPEFREFLHREFPAGASEMAASFTRRNFLTLMGASLALAGLAGCRRPVETIVPYVSRPEGLAPGVPQQYATTASLGLSAYGLLVTSNEGRPTKIDGNPRHPSTQGATDATLQAEILNLYDPDRSRLVLNERAERDWDEFIVFWQELAAGFRDTGGEGLAVLSEPFASPTLSRLRAEFLKTYPAARWVAYEPVSDEHRFAGLQLATGRSLRPVYQYENAAVILALDCDFLLTENESISATRGFAARRRVETTTDDMNRLYVVESRFSVTGTMADHRLRLKSGDIGAWALRLAAALAARGAALGVTLPAVPAVPDTDQDWIDAVADDLLANRGAGLVTVGRGQPAAVHALAFAINSALGNVGSTVAYQEFTDALASSRADLAALTDDMQSGGITTLVMIGGNPVYDAPADLNFQTAMGRVATTIHLATHVNETSAEVTWHIPRLHFLESWSDARAVDGTVSVVQPLIEPLLNGHGDVELAAVLVSGRDPGGYKQVRETWKTLLPTLSFERDWRRVLHDGIMKDSAVPASVPALTGSGLGDQLAGGALAAAPAQATEIIFVPSPAVRDGRYANNGWLQELPDTVTKLTWDNVAQMSDATAQAHGFKNSDIVKLDLDGRELELPVWIVPGHADQSVTVQLGYGRRAAGRVGNGVGVDVYPLRTGREADFAAGLTLTATGRRYDLATTQDHGSMEGRPIVREATLEEFRAHPDFAKDMVKHPPLKSLWKEHSYEESPQWGMSIDLNTCTGCNACTIACQSENNIPVVGKEQVAAGREMHWIRIDRYFTGPVADPQVVVQPVACQHCENAPCEQVCPVAATVHSEDGLNAMVYNRCIGTRYCANNCPYKVRRFNFFNYTKDTPEMLKMAMNPDVTVRFRGVMEKCTYCVQRISGARITAKVEGRDLKDGDVVVACQEACPAGAIVFGDIRDPDSAVSRVKKRRQRYELLAELNVKPRTSYEAKLRNPNPKLG